MEKEFKIIEGAYSLLDLIKEWDISTLKHLNDAIIFDVCGDLREIRVMPKMVGVKNGELILSKRETRLEFSNGELESPKWTWLTIDNTMVNDIILNIRGVFPDVEIIG